MIVRFWGTRGSLPLDSPPSLIRRKLAGALMRAGGRVFSNRAEAEHFIESELAPEFGPGFGGATPCVEIGAAGCAEVILLDAGTGLAAFGRQWRNDRRSLQPTTFHIFLSHLHWDHIQGLPFFEPGYTRGNRIVIHSCHAETEATLRAQMSSPVFPIPLEAFRSQVKFITHDPDEIVAVDGFRIAIIRQNHPGGSYGFRLEREGKSVVYSTDAEHVMTDPRDIGPFVEFFRDADLLIFEAMFSRDEVSYEKAGWGHASSRDAVELAARARVRRIALFHHDPASDDERLAMYESDARRHAADIAGTSGGFPREVFMARDGATVILPDDEN